MTRSANQADLPSDHDIRMARVRLALNGLSVGDGFGEQFFGRSRHMERIVANRDVPRPPWRWTDDTAMAISIADVLNECGGIDQDRLAELFASRYAAEPGRGFGSMAHQILRAIDGGASWQTVSPKAFGGEGSMGNGGAMRVAPVGAYFADDLEQAAHHAARSAEVTHTHPEGIAGAVAVAVAAAKAWQLRDEGALDDASDEHLKTVRAAFVEKVIDLTPDGETLAKIIKASKVSFDYAVETIVHAVGNGSMITAPDTVPFCLWCAARHLTSYDDALWTTVSGGGDIDTNAAIVGGIVAMSSGDDCIPSDWLAGREPLPERFSVE